MELQREIKETEISVNTFKEDVNFESLQSKMLNNLDKVNTITTLSWVGSWCFLAFFLE